MSLFGDLPERALAPDSPRGLGRLMAGGLGKSLRRRNDFYPTPPEATLALLRVEASFIAAHGQLIWEPCARGGAIAAVLSAAGFAVIASDIVEDPQHDVAQADLLLLEAALSGVVITNPPFALAAAMIKHLLGGLGCRYVALLLKTTFWSADVRRGLLMRFPVARRYDLTWRLDFTDGGNPTMECSWFVWDSLAPILGQWRPLSRDADGALLDCAGR